MRKQQLSPLASVLTALALVLGILVADLTNTYTLTTASAQSKYDDTAMPVSDAVVVSDRIVAIDVVVNGVVTSAVFDGPVKVVDSVLVTDGYTTANGVNIGDTLTGVNIGDTLTGVNIGDTLTGVNIGDNTSTVSGGTVQGTNVQVVDGVITGEDLTIVGTIVSANVSDVVMP